MQNSDIVPDFELINRVLFDWLNFTSKLHDVKDVLELIGMQDVEFENLPGNRGFTNRLYFNGVSIHYCSVPGTLQEGLVWLEMSGQGCRTFETYGNGNYQELFELALAEPKDIHITRLDVAYDDFTGLLNIDQICDQTREEHFTSRSNTYQAIYSNKGNSVLFGTRNSNVLIRIYDKAAERGYDNTKLHWIRCELQIKDVNAMGFIKQLQSKELIDVYLGVLKNYLLFRDPSENDSNKRRWQVSPWWDRFLKDAERLSIWSKPGTIYNLSTCERYVLSQPVGSIKTMIEVHGAEAFIEIIQRCPPSKNPKYKRIIDEYRETQRLRLEDSTWRTITTDDDLEFFRELQERLAKERELDKARNSNLNDYYSGASIKRDAERKNELYAKRLKEQARKDFEARIRRELGYKPEGDDDSS